MDNQTLNNLVVDESVSSHVIPVLLEHYDKECIPTCLLRTSTYTLNISEVLKVLTPDVM